PPVWLLPDTENNRPVRLTPYNETDFLEYVEILQNEEHFFDILGMEELDPDEQASAPINRLLIQESLLEFDDYAELLSSKKGRIYYVPEKEALLAYEDDFYHEITPQYSAMYEFCKTAAKIGKKMTIEDLMDELLFIICGEDSDPFEALEFVNKFSVQLDVIEKKLPEFIRLYCDLHNNTRNPYLNGFTPTEWFQRTGDIEDSRYLDPEDY
ncbi:MAG: hypothetical protein ACI4Q4_08330, partial [Oscillospiraceae bacterium]